jgi:hypothetical protein
VDKEKKLQVTPASLITTGDMFICTEGLAILRCVLTTVGIANFMIQTGNYSLSNEFILGNRGAPLDEARTFALRMLLVNPSDAANNAAFIRTVLFGDAAVCRGLPLIASISRTNAPPSAQHAYIPQCESHMYRHPSTHRPWRDCRRHRHSNACPSTRPNAFVR